MEKNWRKKTFKIESLSCVQEAIKNEIYIPIKLEEIIKKVEKEVEDDQNSKFQESNQ